MKGLPYSPYITLEGSSFGSNFREVSVGIILNLFWVVFHEYSLKSFTSDTIKLTQKNEFLTLRAFRFTLSWRYIIVVSFISIAFVSFKLKNFPNFAYRFSIHERALFGRFLGPYSPSMVQYYRKSHQRQYSRKKKYCLKIF